MKISNINYYFKPRDVLSTTFHIGGMYSNLGYISVDKESVLKRFGLKDENLKGNKYFLKDIRKKVELVNDENISELNVKCIELQKLWDINKDKLIKILSSALDIQFDENIYNSICYLSLLPINEINLNEGIIYLDYNNDIKQLFINFIIMLVKQLLIKRWQQNDELIFNSSYENDTKLWMFVEIAVDAVFYNTDLKGYTEFPSYKYFYSLKIDNINFIEEFRKLFSKVGIVDFCNEIYAFVYRYFDKLSKFKNYLY